MLRCVSCDSLDRLLVQISRMTVPKGVNLDRVLVQISRMTVPKGVSLERLLVQISRMTVPTGVESVTVFDVQSVVFVVPAEV